MEKSDYFNSLEAHVQNRYKVKIAYINDVDPYLLKNQDCKVVKPDQHETFQYLPPVSFSDIYCYLIEGISPYSKEQLKNYKSLTGYNQFVSGFVREVLVKTFDSHILVKGTVMHSQRLNEPPLKPWVIVNANNSSITCGHCNCMAGLDESCSHVAALLFYVDYAVRFREKTTVTGVKAYWSVPIVKNVLYVPVAEMNVSSATARRKHLDSLVAPIETVENSSVIEDPDNSLTGHSSKKVSCVLVQNHVPMATDADHKRLADKLFSHGEKAAYFSTNRNYQAEYIPKCINEAFPILLTELFDEKTKGLSFDDLLKHCESIKIDFTAEQAKKVEEKSKLQSKSKMWNHFRAGRITASNFHRACHSNPENPSASLISVICYPNSHKFETNATKWGITNEEVMRKEYVKEMEQKHNNFQWEIAGLCLNPKYPFLGASPDGFVCCDCCGKGILEVKCPYSLKDQSYKEGLLQPKFCLTEISKINRNHEYYSQVQAQLFVTERLYVDFCVWTNVDFCIDRVFPDEDFWKSECPKAEKFFKKAILPQLVGKHFTDDPSLKENQPKRKRGKKNVGTENSQNQPLTPSGPKTFTTFKSVNPNILSPSKRFPQNLSLTILDKNVVGKTSTQENNGNKNGNQNKVDSQQNIVEAQNKVDSQENKGEKENISVSQGEVESQGKMGGKQKIFDSQENKDEKPDGVQSQKKGQPLGSQEIEGEKQDEVGRRSKRHKVERQGAFKNKEKDDDSHEAMDSDGNEPWCYCKEPESGSMIYCESEICTIKWFHIQCLNIKRIPKGKWICKECSKELKKRVTKKRQ